MGNVNDEIDVVVYKTDNTVSLVPHGRIFGDNGTVFRRVAETHLSNRIDQFIINLSNVGFIDSAGLGALVSLKGRCAENKVEFLVLNPPPPVAQIFAVARLDAIFNIVHGSEAAALSSSIETEENRVVLREASLETVEALQPVPSIGASAPTVAAGVLAESDGDSEGDRVGALCREALERVRLGEYARAVDLYQEALALAPDCMPALNNLAIVYEKKPNWTVQAIETWEKVLALSHKLDDPKHIERAERRLHRLRGILSER